MQFLYPSLLVGLIAALVPVIIYLLLRRRKSEVRWGASYLLRLTLTSKRRSSLWRQLVVLTVRCLILALAALLIAQLFQRNPQPASLLLEAPAQPVHRAVLYDTTLSMATPEGGETRAARLRTALACILRSQRACDTATLIPLTAAVPDPAKPHAPAQALHGRVKPAQVHAVVSAILPAEGRVTLAPAVTEALTRLASTPRAQKDLYILSDFPRELEAEAADLTWITDAAAKANVRIVPVSLALPGATAANVAVHRLTLGTDWVAAGVPLTLYAETENCADVPTTVKLELRIDGKLSGTITATLQPNERRPLPETIVLTKAGTVTVEVAPAGIRPETGAGAALVAEVHAQPLVWVLAPAAAGMAAGGQPGEAEFLLRALAGPEKDKAPLRVETPEPRAFSLPIPETVDVIVAAGFPLTAAMGRALAEFTRRGGGLLLACGPDVNPTSWNENLAELLPVGLDKPWRESVDPEVFLPVSPAAADLRPQLFAEFATDRNGNLQDIRVYNHLGVRDSDTAPGVLLRLASGEPYLVHRAVGRGHVLLLTSSLGISWSSLAMQRCHLPLVLRLLNAAAAGRGFARNLEPGQTFLAPWGKAEAVTVSAPDGMQSAAINTPGVNRQFVTVNGGRQRGLYRLQGVSGLRDAFAVCAANPESDLRSLPAVPAEKLAARLGAPLYAGWSQAVAAVGPADRRLPSWPWLLVAMLSLYLFESWFIRSL